MLDLPLLETEARFLSPYRPPIFLNVSFFSVFPLSIFSLPLLLNSNVVYEYFVWKDWAAYVDCQSRHIQYVYWKNRQYENSSTICQSLSFQPLWSLLFDLCLTNLVHISGSFANLSCDFITLVDLIARERSLNIVDRWWCRLTWLPALGFLRTRSSSLWHLPWFPVPRRFPRP